MSEFDKEAERERLREKYAEEEADRASTQHMSELLLQGMTMTDRHCPECTSPLFRDGDRLFCPECQRDVVESDQQSTQPQPPAQSDPAPSGADRPADETPSRPVSTDGATARADLQAALERSAAAAAAAEDPRTAREHLKTAREAIEALRALDGGDRSGTP